MATPFPIALPAGSVLGRLALTAGDAESVTLSQLAAAISSLLQFTPVTVTGATYAPASTDTCIIANASATQTVTLPSAVTYPGRQILYRTIAAFTVVSGSSNVVPLAGGAAGTAILAAIAGKWALLVSDGTAWQIMASN